MTDLPFLRDLVFLLLLSLAIVLIFQRLRLPPISGCTGPRKGTQTGRWRGG